MGSLGFPNPFDPKAQRAYEEAKKAPSGANEELTYPYDPWDWCIYLHLGSFVW